MRRTAVTVCDGMLFLSVYCYLYVDKLTSGSKSREMCVLDKW